MALKEQIELLLESYLDEGKYFIVDIQIKPARGSQKVLILVDSDEGITIQECAEMSRQLGERLEEDALVETAYTLEVSSPGLDQPLRLPRQYRKNVGRELKLTLTSGEVLVGTLLEAGETGIVLQKAAPKKRRKGAADAAGASEEDLRLDLSFDAISKAMVQVSFK